MTYIVQHGTDEPLYLSSQGWTDSLDEADKYATLEAAQDARIDFDSRLLNGLMPSCTWYRMDWVKVTRLDTAK